MFTCQAEKMRKEMNNKLRPLQVVGIADSEGMYLIAAYKRDEGVKEMIIIKNRMNMGRPERNNS